jgi:hypothetical protein
VKGRNLRLFSKRVISNFEGDPYLVRYTLISTSWFRVFIHKILRSDDDRDLHDHPWNFWTFLLWGRYTEEVPVDQRWKDGPKIKCRFGPGSLIRHKASDCHRLELDTTFEQKSAAEGHWRVFKPVWTLFIAGPRLREWGFHTANGWIDWRTYVYGRDADMSEMNE